MPNESAPFEPGGTQALSRAPAADSVERLEGLAAASATGELVCAMANVEVHIHLQQGRIAWATTSLARLAFTRYVVEECEIDADALRELVFECQRERKPLGETLVAWGVATTEQVRAALRRQIVEAVGSLDRDAETVFLQRGDGYRTYNDVFTFTLHEISQVASPASALDQLASRLSSLPPPDGPRARLRSLVAQEPGIRWAELYRSGQLVERLPRSPSEESHFTSLARLLPSIAHSVVIRRQVGSIVGFALDEPGESIWCGLTPDALVGTMCIVAQEHMDVARVGEPVGVWKPAPALIGEERGIPRLALTEAMLRSDFLSAVVLLDADRSQHYLAWRRGFARGAEEARLGELSGLLANSRVADPPEAGDLPHVLPSVSARDRDRALFGGELIDGSGRQLWLIFESLGNHGLGWALLTALRRTSLTH